MSCRSDVGRLARQWLHSSRCSIAYPFLSTDDICVGLPPTCVPWNNVKALPDKPLTLRIGQDAAFRHLQPQCKAAQSNSPHPNPSRTFNVTPDWRRAAPDVSAVSRAWPSFPCDPALSLLRSGMMPRLIRRSHTAAAATIACPAPRLDLSTSSNVPSIHTNVLLRLVKNPTTHSWSAASVLVQQQVPARMQHLQQCLRQISKRMHSDHHPHQAPTNLHHPPSQPSSPLNDWQHSTHRQVFIQTIDAACKKTQKSLDRFLTTCIPVEGMPAQHAVQEREAVAGAKWSSIPGLSAGAAVAEATDNLLHDVDADCDRLTWEFRRVTERPGWWQEAPDVLSSMDELMDVYMTYILSMRVLLHEVLCCWTRLRRAHGLDGMGFSGDGHASGSREAARWSMAGPKGPPGWEEEQAKREPASLLMPDAPLVQLLRLATEDTRAFCIEKNSTAPEVIIEGHDDLKHIYGEILKNSMQALIDKHGAWDVDEAEPIHVSVDIVCTPIPEPIGYTRRTLASAPEPLSRHLRLTIMDHAGGLSSEKLQRCQHWFSSLHVSERDHGFGYSRDHGSQFQGMGVGMPLSCVYARFMGGYIQWVIDEGKGTTKAQLFLPGNGFSF